MSSLKIRITLLTLLMLVLSLWLLSLYTSYTLRVDIQNQLADHQFSAVSFLAKGMDGEINTRLTALELKAQQIDSALMQDPVRLQAFLDGSPVTHSLFNGGITALASDGTALADAPRSNGRTGVNYIQVDYVAASLQQGKAMVGKPIMGPTLNVPVFGMGVPIRDKQGAVIGALSGVTNLGAPNFIDKYTSQGFGKTGGILLAAPQYRLIVTASDKSRIMETVPPVGVIPELDRFQAGTEGSAVYVNPRGVEVMASAKKIPASGWMMVAILPTVEALAPISAMQANMLWTTLLLTLLTAGLVWWVLKRQLAPMVEAARVLECQADQHLPAQPLAVTRQDEIGLLISAINHAMEMASQREKELLESEQLFREAQRVAGLGSYALDIASGHFTCSGVCDTLFGIDATYPHTVAGWETLIHPDDHAMMTEHFYAEVLGRGQLFNREYRVVRAADGAVRWIHGLGQLEFDAQGRPSKMRGTIRDIHALKLAELATQASSNRLQATLDALPDLLFEVGLDGRIFQFHTGRKELLAATPEEFLGKTFSEVLPPEVAQLVLGAIAEAAQSGLSSGKRYRLKLPQGERWFDMSVAAMATMQDNDERFILIARDISERQQAEERLQLAASVFSHAREGITITDAHGTIVDVNDAFARITGYSREEALGQNPRFLNSGRQDAAFYAGMWDALVEQGHWNGEIWNRRKSGEVFAELLTISAVRDTQGNTQQYVALFSDITATKAHQSQLEHIAHFDALTNLPNRILLADRLQQAMVQAQRRGQQLAVAYLDLDGFKLVNDHHGHDVGDQLLIALATAMKDTLREGDTLARIGGDEFVAVLIDLDGIESCGPMLTRLLEAAAAPVQLGDVVLQCSASIGVTFYPQNQDIDADQLLRQADQAMYQAKLAGKNRYHVFDAVQDSSMRVHHESLDRLRLAHTRREFVLHYQPKVNMRSGQVIGAEALIRWQHPEKSLLEPASFLSIIEDHPLAVEVGEWVIDAALTQMEVWHAVGLDLPVSVNIGARQLQQSNFMERLQVILARHPQVSPACLELEVLETSALADMAQVSQVIEDCAKMGVKFALDDFGTGYSSLTYLKRLRVAQLKIDQSFVRGMLNDPDDMAILEGVIGLAAAFKHEVIAEGVETIAHGTLLLQLGCELAQGYGISRPMPPDLMPAWEATWKPDAAWCAVPDPDETKC
jgi:diguanylate cyclase (GGDEF)-like protein/PAS domain S-box-containing protein